eukprot:m.239381 g.239381  ORF g.239381 m.239381 type:complete len:67 (+) comp17432_c1_seq35:16-216(+)
MFAYSYGVLQVASNITSLPLQLLKTEVAQHINSRFGRPDKTLTYSALVSKLETQYHLINLSTTEPA